MDDPEVEQPFDIVVVCRQQARRIMENQRLAHIDRPRFLSQETERPARDSHASNETAAAPLGA